jgi:peptidoglycan/LPS O-acetylase OafA/YrhL
VPAPTASRIAALTGLRAVAALAVCVSHAAFWAGDFTPDTKGAIYARLETAVPFFFALSGFLLIRPWLLRADTPSAPPPDLRRYLGHRAWRVLPAYWTTVTVVYLIYLWRPDVARSGHGWDGYLRHLAFLQIYGVGHVHTGLPQTWSLCVEVVFYLALPLLGAALVWCARRGLPRPTVPVALFLVSLGWVAFVCATGAFGKTSRSWPPSYAMCLAAGMFVAMLVGRVRWRRRHGLACSAAAIAAFAVLLTPVAGPLDLAQPNALQGSLKLGLEALVAGLLVALFALGPGTSVASRALGGRVMVWLGEISYEYFLLHVMVMDVVVLNIFGWSLFRGHTWPIVVVTSLITVPLAWALHAGVERLHAAVRVTVGARR